MDLKKSLFIFFLVSACYPLKPVLNVKYLVCGGEKRKERTINQEDIVIIKKIGEIGSSEFYIGLADDIEIALFKLPHVFSKTNIKQGIKDWYKLYYSLAYGCSGSEIKICEELVERELKEVLDYKGGEWWLPSNWWLPSWQGEREYWFYFCPDCIGSECVAPIFKENLKKESLK